VSDKSVAQNPRSVVVLLGVIALVLVGLVLYAARPVMVLVVLAFFLAVLIHPLVRWLERFTAKWLALVLTILLIGAGIGGTIVALFFQGKAVATKLPEYAKRFESMLEGIQELLRSWGFEMSWSEMGTADAAGKALEFAIGGIGSLVTLSAETVLVLVMVMFMVVEVPSFRHKIEASMDLERRARVMDSMDSATLKIQRYVTTKVVVSLVVGILTSLVSWLLDLDFPIIWGVIAFQFNFIPYVGANAAVIPPAIIALVQFEEPLVPFALCVGILGTLHFIIGNIIEPRIMGRSLELSPTVVFSCMLFWGWLWGMMGVVLAVPLTALVAIVCAHVEPLKPIALWLGEDPETAAHDT
jgi:predicted PurR-regulated permease PerM